MKTLLTIFVLFFSSSVVARVIRVDECTIPFDFTIGSICVLGTFSLMIIVPLALGVVYGVIFYGFALIKETLISLFNRPKFKKDENNIDRKRETTNSHVIIKCPNCITKIRLQKGKVGIITCPSCQRKVYTSTK